MHVSHLTASAIAYGWLWYLVNRWAGATGAGRWTTFYIVAAEMLNPITVLLGG